MYYMPILYCVYALVGGVISIRDPYKIIIISAPFTSLCHCQRIARCLPQARCMCSENVAIGFKTSIEVRGKNSDAEAARG